MELIEEQEYAKSLEDYFGILKRRKLALLLPAALIVAVAFALALGLPALYQSQAIILIEEQEVPQDFVRSTITSFAAQQVQVISQRVLTVRNISDIVEKFNLYQEEVSRRLPATELARLFRDRMQLDLVSADVIDPRSGRPTQATIAFTLAFQDPNPVTAQQVTNELVTLYLNENLRNRTDQAVSTAEFLEEEASQLNDELTALEQRLADFKSANEGSLPELYQFNLTTLERTQREISDVRLRMQELEKRKVNLAAEMAQLSPSAPFVLPSGEVVLSDADRLKSLRAEYRRKAALYNDNHPDVERLSREVEELQAELGMKTDVRKLRRELNEQNRYLGEIRNKYNDNHQEVINTQRLIAHLEQNIREAGAESSTDQPYVVDNPAYVLLQTQANAAEFEIQTLLGKHGELASKMVHYESMLKRAPHVEQDYQALLRDYDNATVKYQDIKAKQREATVSKNMEQEQKGERFTLIEPPALPLDPVSPNRPAIMLVGLVLALGAGMGIALVRESIDAAIHGARELTAIMGEAPLVVIPYIDNEVDVVKKGRAWKRALAAAVLTGLLFVIYVHFFVKPVDVLYFMVRNTLGLS